MFSTVNYNIWNPLISAEILILLTFLKTSVVSKVQKLFSRLSDVSLSH